MQNFRCHQKAIFQSDESNFFENVKIDDVLSLRETGLYEKIWRIKTG